jgi:Tol biopolymer transport system component
MGRPRILFFLLLFSLVFVACDKIEQGSLDVINPEINEEENRAVEEEIEAIELQVPNEVKEAHEESIDIEQPVSQVNEPIVDDQGENLVQVLKSDRILSAGPFYGVLPQIYWSPLGTHLAIKGAAAGQGVWVLDLKKEQIHQAIRLPQRIDSNCTNLQILGWSADGEKLYFIIEGLQVTEPYLGKTGLFLGEVVLADGSATVAEVLWVQDGYSGISQFKLVKDNNFLLCHRAGELWRINIQTAAKELLAANLPQWDGLFQVTVSPTGKYIAYQLERNGKNGIAILNTENGHEAVLLENDDYHFFPVWNPAEDKIAFLTGVALQGEGYDYYQGEDGALPPATKIQVYNVEGEQIVTYQLEEGKSWGSLLVK